MPNFTIDIQADVKRVTRSLGEIAEKQIPFATSQAINELAALVQADEKKNIQQKFDRPTPFTVNSVAIKRASKSSPEATVYVRDIAAQYLEPYDDGGKHFLSGRALLNPKNTNINQYGNIPKGYLKRLKGRPGIFIGTVRFKKSGQTVSGVWQRPFYRLAGEFRGKHRAGGPAALAAGTNTTGRLILLIRFGDALPVDAKLHFGERAQAIVDGNFDAVFGRNLALAIASAK